jgi:SAM-dependent methyltransferase
MSMAVSDQHMDAVHLEGGNYFDDMQIDIAKSHLRFDSLPRTPKNIKQSKYRNLAKLLFTRLCLRFGIHEFLIVNGIRKKWLNDFTRYWAHILKGRPFWNTLDFFMLLHDYRKRQQHTSQLEWHDATQHLANWQHPSHIYATLHSVRNLAVHPIVNLNPLRKMPKNGHILEYGCSLAPYYACYREFFSHLNCQWVLGDIPNFPFHYAKYLYQNDEKVDFVTIYAKNFSNPLQDIENFDVIILTTVLEHLDDPLFISEYLINKLKPGGLFVFDYIKSEGEGLDHPNALTTREDCIQTILSKTRLIYGKADDISKSMSLCIVQKS